MQIREATGDDAGAVAAIFNQGVADRVATFETREQTAQDAAEMIVSARVLLVAEIDGAVVGWAKAARYADAHHYYDGVAEATLYVERSRRRGGIGRALLEALAAAGAPAGLHKLVGKVFTSNAPSIALLRELGWREVGIHRRHGQLDGEWKDVLVVELLLVAGD
jgi:phosphinothricin acetyltransferase